MKLENLTEQCLKAMQQGGPIVLTIPGKWGNRKKARLWKGGPLCTIVASYHDNRILVSGDPVKILAAIEKLTNDKAIPW